MKNQAGDLGRQGFTLIELLVVIAIISLLASILMPSLQAARELAKGVQCTSQLRLMGFGMTLYSNDYDGRLMPWVQAGDLDARGWNPTVWSAVLAGKNSGTNYLGDIDPYKNNIYCCPCDNPIIVGDNIHLTRSYLMDDVSARLPGGGYILSEGIELATVSPAVPLIVEYWGADWIPPICSFWDASPYSLTFGPHVVKHHPGGANVMFMDNHIECVSEADAPNLDWPKD